jgi:predicted nucleotidyltransferase
MNADDHRHQLLKGLCRFVASVQQIAGVRRIAVLGSIVTTKPDPKDIDVLVVVADDADLTPLATCARRLQGHAQSFNRGADVFLADERGIYIGRACHWKDCRPGVRRSCDALHCGRRPYLHDDLDAITLNRTLVLAPPVTLWPHVERRGGLPPDVEEVVAALEHARLTSHAPDGAWRHVKRRW